MNSIDYWGACLLIAAVRRSMQRETKPAVLTYFMRKGGFRSLLFKVNSHAFHNKIAGLP